MKQMPHEYYSKEEILAFQKKEEKGQIRKAATKISIAFIIMTVIMVYWSTPVVTLFQLIEREDLLKYFSTPMAEKIIQITVSSVAFLFPYFLLLKIAKVKLSDIGEYRKPQRTALFLPLILMGIGFCGFSNIATDFAGKIFSIFGITKGGGVSSSDPEGVFGFIVSFITVAVFPALIEEFALRGVVMGILRRFGDGFAVIVSAALFGLMHGNVTQIPFAFLLGLFFGYAVIKTGSIWTAVIIHFFNNGCAFLYSYILKSLPVKFVPLLVYGYNFFFIVLGIIGLLLLSRKKGTDFALNNNSGGVLTVKEKLLTYLLSPLTLVCLGLVAYETFIVRW